MIAREGILLILIGLVLSLIFLWAAVKWDSLVLLIFTAIFSLLTVFTTFFMRDPHRTFEPAPNILVAPADGKILSVDRISDHEYIGGEVWKISIFLSVLDVHINRVPADGVVEFVDYCPGKFFPAFADKASTDNERTEIGILSSGGHRLVVKQIAGIIARRVVCTLSKGDSVAAGDHMGLIRYGSRTELFVPIASRIDVKAGDKVKGARTVMGYLPGNVTEVKNSETTGEKNVEL